MTVFPVTIGDRIIDPMIVLAGCSTRDRILVAGSKGIEIMIELHRCGYLGAAFIRQLRASRRSIRFRIN
jgi:hypothetical protein